MSTVRPHVGRSRIEEKPAGQTESAVALRDRAGAAWVSLLARLVLAAVFGYAAASKIGDSAATVRSVRAYRLVPESAVHAVAYALPSFELVLAVLLLVGVASRLVGIISAGALVVFIAAVSSAALRGLRIDCGCFGGGGVVTHTHYLLEIGRDVLLVVVALAVVGARRSRWSVDEFLARPLVQADRSVSTNSRAPKARTAAVRREAAVQLVRRRRSWATAGAGSMLALACIIGIAVNAAPSARGGVATASAGVPAGITAAGGVVVGSASAPVKLIAYEDPQCPVCAQFEQTNGSTLQQAVAAGKVSVEYRMRSFLGVESVRADNALAAAQQEGKFEALREALFSHQPKEGTGGYTTADLLALGQGVGLNDAAFVNAVQSMTYASWVAHVDDRASRDGNVATPELIRVGGQPLTQVQTFDAQQFKAAIAS
jgi:protein-disulfide isomerase